jgi:hypothetical protein
MKDSLGYTPLAPITITPLRGNTFGGIVYSITVGERVVTMLTFDEMLGEIATLTHPIINFPSPTPHRGLFTQSVDRLVGRMEDRAERRARLEVDTAQEQLP